jgi:hypothetical protein
MKRFIAPMIALSLALSASTAFAGGPIIIEEEGQPEVIVDKPRSGWIVPVIIGIVVICAIACGDDEERIQRTQG